MKKCKHCKMNIDVRNPSGFCDHLYYPENCKVCNKGDRGELRKEINKCIRDWDKLGMGSLDELTEDILAIVGRP